MTQGPREVVRAGYDRIGVAYHVWSHESPVRLAVVQQVLDRLSSAGARIAGWLHPGGLLVTSAPIAAGDGVAANWLGVPMFFGGIGVEATLSAVEAAGLVVEEAQVRGEDEGQGRVVEFLWVTATRPR